MDKVTPFQWKLVFLIIALTLASLLYNALSERGLEQTAALFIGLPALLAIIVALTPKAKSITGMILKGLTIALLMSGIFLREGFICILMAAPLFYLVGGLIGWAITYFRHTQAEDGRTDKKIYGFILLPFLLLSLEGVLAGLSFERAETVIVTQVVAAGAGEVEQSLSQPPRFDQPLPFYLRLGFPRPVAGSGAGLATGDRRIIQFSGPQGFYGAGPAGALALTVVERTANQVRFQINADASKIAHWLSWQETEVRWVALDPDHTQVTWTLHYQRELDPAWYFGPWERYAVQLTGAYLIDTLATP